MNMQGEPLRVMFAGYPSAGKTTAVCALLGARVGQTSVDRATTGVWIFGDKDTNSFKDDPRYVDRPALATSDDPIPVRFVIIDTPGVADAAEGANSAAAGYYTGLARGAVKISDVVLWLSPAPTAFLTRDEVAQFHSLVAAARAEELATGRLVQVGVLLTKYEIDDGAQESDDDEPVELLEGEVANKPGANSLRGRFEVARKIVAEVDPDGHIPVLKFSAHNRIRGGGSVMSKAVRTLVRYMCKATPVINGEFHLGWATRDLDEKRVAAAFRAYAHRYVETLKATATTKHYTCGGNSHNHTCRQICNNPQCSYYYDACGQNHDPCSSVDCNHEVAAAERERLARHQNLQHMAVPISWVTIDFGPVAAATADLLQMGGSAVAKFAALVATDPRRRVTRLAAAIGPLPDGEGRAAVVAAIEEAAGLPTIRLGSYENGRSAVGSLRDPFRDDALRERATWLAERAAVLLPGSATALAVEVMASYKRIQPSAANRIGLQHVANAQRRPVTAPLRALFKVQERFARLRYDMWGAWENEVDQAVALQDNTLLPLGVALLEQPENLLNC